MASSSRSVRLSSSSLYDILGIDKSASVDDVRKAYKRKALATHPDKLNPDATEDERIHAETQFRKVCLSIISTLAKCMDGWIAFR
ncbi:hypothetical protein L208DRAFT_1411381 [Tricholoma matsutake]|nr:hypothetical protein L208DRAFT_1411381 [Tricholoma matsutake 945]